MMVWGTGEDNVPSAGYGGGGSQEDQVGGVKRKCPMVAMTVPKTTPAPSGRDAAKEGMLRNHCENMVE